jgi:hypothetical protein
LKENNFFIAERLQIFAEQVVQQIIMAGKCGAFACRLRLSAVKKRLRNAVGW